MTVRALAEKRSNTQKIPSLREVYEDYKQIRALRPNTIKIYDKALDWGVSDWMDLPVSKITKSMVVERHALLSKRGCKRGEGKVFANNTFRTVRCLVNYAMYRYEDAEGEPLIKSNPVRALAELRLWNRNTRRDTHVHPLNMPGWYQAVMNHPNKTQRDYLILLLFTGLRRTEGATLKWRNIDFTTKTLRLESTKNGKPHVLPLGPFIMQILTVRYWYHAGGPNDYVFPGAVRNTPISQNNKSYEIVWEETGTPFMLHDLRRTFLTIAESLDIPHYALKRLANHSSGDDVTAGYIIVSPERLREPMERIETKLIQLSGAEMRF